jgi:hypothetical protein
MKKRAHEPLFSQIDIILRPQYRRRQNPRICFWREGFEGASGPEPTGEKGDCIKFLNSSSGDHDVVAWPRKIGGVMTGDLVLKPNRKDE